MKIDPEEQARQLCLNFDSVPVCRENTTYKEVRPARLTLAYSSGSIKSPEKEADERELIISQTVSFARKLSW